MKKNPEVETISSFREEENVVNYSTFLIGEDESIVNNSKFSTSQQIFGVASSPLGIISVLQKLEKVCKKACSQRHVSR